MRQGPIHKDYDAIKAALSLSWSNGQVEGQINRLKLIKRQMYGRGGFELLKKRVLYRIRDGWCTKSEEEPFLSAGNKEIGTDAKPMFTIRSQHMISPIEKGTRFWPTFQMENTVWRGRADNELLVLRQCGYKIRWYSLSSSGVPSRQSFFCITYS